MNTRSSLICLQLNVTRRLSGIGEDSIRRSLILSQRVDQETNGNARK